LDDAQWRVARIIQQLVSSLLVLLAYGMERVKGIGGVFFRAKDPKGLQAWYQKNLGIEPDADGYVVFKWAEREPPHNPASSV